MRIMALPADVPFAMSCHVDSCYFFGSFSIISMTFSTEFSHKWFFWTEIPGTHFVFFRCFVASCTRDIQVVGNGFCPCNLGMAGLAFFGYIRRPGVVCVMTSDTGFHRIMGF